MGGSVTTTAKLVNKQKSPRLGPEDGGIVLTLKTPLVFLVFPVPQTITPSLMGAMVKSANPAVVATGKPRVGIGEAVQAVPLNRAARIKFLSRTSNLVHANSKTVGTQSHPRRHVVQLP